MCIIDSRDQVLRRKTVRLVKVLWSKKKVLFLQKKIRMMMGFEIMGAQAQDTSPNVGIKIGHSTRNRPLMVSLKGRPKTRAQFSPLKG